MNRAITYIFVLGLLSIGSSTANAALKFGSEDKVRFVANVTFTGSNGERLYLARKIVFHNFLVPYSVEDKGYILGISGESEKFYELPESGKLSSLQDKGYLPKPLPEWELDFMDWAFGHFLWFLVAGFVIYFAFKFAIKKFRSA